MEDSHQTWEPIPGAGKQHGEGSSLKVGSPDHQQHHLRACGKCKFAGPTWAHLLNQKLGGVVTSPPGGSELLGRRKE